MRVEETYHRVDRDTLDLTVKNKFVLHRQPANFDIREMICAPSEAEEYKKEVAEPAMR
jgi:hypothetical protein